MEYSIGIDLGGTDIKAGLLSESGEISCRLVMPTDADAGGKVVASRIAEAVLRVIEKAKTAGIDARDLVGIGIGSPGLIIAQTGVVHFSPNLEGWADVPLADYVKAELAELELPIFIDNDVNAMTLGELSHGAGVGLKNIVCLTLGTGVGGGVVIDGKVYHGSGNTAGELGHTVVIPDGRFCGCGNQGCLEAYAGARHIVERTIQKIESGRRSSLTHCLSDLTPKRISEAAQTGDELAVEILAETGRYIGIALTSVAHILNPQMAIIGGGIAEAGEKLLFEPIRAEVSKRAMDIPAKTMRIVKAQLGNDAGLVGAAMLAFQA
ncbi:MAG: ROK family protein [Candidatus Poribacteria bacterium]|nr:ROK family protein [Candidatus Poribacteria bacterium]